jgi:hypothetical protein
MTVVVNSFEKYQYAPIGSPRLRVIWRELSFLALLWDCKTGVGLHASLFEWSQYFIKVALRSSVLLVMLCKRVSKSTLIMQLS